MKKSTIAEDILQPDMVSYLAVFAFLSGIALPFISGKWYVVAEILPSTTLLAIITILLGSAMYYGFASILISLAVGVRVSYVFTPLGKIILHFLTLMNFTPGKENFSSLLFKFPTANSMYNILFVLITGTFLCYSAGWFGTEIHKSSSGKIIFPLIIFTVSSVGIFYLGVF